MSEEKPKSIVANLESRIQKIEFRNKKVETDKAWETSWTRRLTIFFLTYFLIGFYMNSIDVINPWLNAVIPSLGFLLSTLTIGWIKKLWIIKQKI